MRQARPRRRGSRDRLAEPPRERDGRLGVAPDERGHEGAADDHAVGEPAGGRRLLGGRDADPHEQRWSRDGPEGGHELAAVPASSLRAAGDAVGGDAVDEATDWRTRSLASRSSARAGRRQEHGLHVVRGRPLDPLPRLVDGQVRHGSPPPPRPRGHRSRNASKPQAVHGVHVGHHGDRDVQTAPSRSSRGCRTGCAPAASASRRRLLDHPAVHHGVGERDPDLDRVGAGVAQRPQQGRVDAGQAPGHVRDERAPAAVPAARGGRASSSGTGSLQRRAHRVQILVAASRQADEDPRALRQRPLQQPSDHVRRLQRRQDALGASERLEPGERLVVGRADTYSASPASCR